MELLGPLLRGLVIGFSIAAPVGPIGVLCIRRTLTDGRSAGFLSGLGAASADALYGCVAAFGLTSVSNLLVDQQLLVRLVGGAFLLYLGLRIFREWPAEREAAIIGGTSYGGLARAYSSTFLLTLTNPLTILSFAAIFAGLGLIESAGYVLAAVLVLGVFSGSALWWLLLSGGVSLFPRGSVSARCAGRIALRARSSLASGSRSAELAARSLAHHDARSRAINPTLPRRW